MSAAPPRLLFVPVSGPRGMGEYGRALAMADAVAQLRPDALVHFAVSRHAPYAHSVPYAATLLPSSPTFHSAQIAALIRKFAPDVVIFDNAGRSAQLRAARAAGARVIFVSARARQRRKAFRLRWMYMLDEHWIAYPALLAGELTWLERLKLRTLGRPRVRFLDPVLPASDERRSAALLQRFGVTAHEYVVVVPGGGTEHPGAAGALRAIAAAAARIAASAVPTVLIALDASAHDDPPELHRAGRLPMAELAELLRGARLVIANGGYTLLQALACDCACIAVPLAKDQSERIERCVAAGIALRGEPQVSSLTDLCLAVLNDDAQLLELRAARERARIGSGAQAVASVLLGSGG